MLRRRCWLAAAAASKTYRVTHTHTALYPASQPASSSDATVSHTNAPTHIQTDTRTHNASSGCSSAWFGRRRRRRRRRAAHLPDSLATHTQQQHQQQQKPHCGSASCALYRVNFVREPNLRALAPTAAAAAAAAVSEAPFFPLKRLRFLFPLFALLFASLWPAAAAAASASQLKSRCLSQPISTPLLDGLRRRSADGPLIGQVWIRLSSPLLSFRLPSAGGSDRALAPASALFDIPPT